MTTIERAVKEADVYAVAVRSGYITRRVVERGVVVLVYRDRAAYERLRRDAGLA